ncbi:hypothetical protein OIU34_02300 [Pararhizobium sp. BT-229]|uniref:hypothetical protein n=1 Tax=Pararhizobium sp. BT-229 TaxID=2986923 RepID=UPI0021F74D6B|nr:hypothetical protein [Pararhizobium sp. BT-229]MCV9960718.1 hypothetical protein [Pararhizobium sp. BT-229]
MSKVLETHDELVNVVVPAILTGPIEAGGDVADVMTVLASVVVGVVSVCADFDSNEKALDILIEDVRNRLSGQALRNAKTLGSA